MKQVLYCITYQLKIEKIIGLKLFNLFEIYLKLFILFNYVFDKI